MELVITERLLHEDRKTKERASGIGETGDGAAMMVKSGKRRGPRCHNCHRLERIQRNCPERSRTEQERTPVISGSYREKRSTQRQRINQVSVDGWWYAMPMHCLLEAQRRQKDNTYSAIFVMMPACLSIYVTWTSRKSF